MSDWKSADLSSADYYVFDDFPPERVLSLYKQFMGCQLNFTVTDKYMAKLTISNSYPKPSIFCFNPKAYQEFWAKADGDWLIGNVNTVIINESLFV